MNQQFMETRYSPNQIDYQRLNTEQLRTTFLIESLFAPGRLEMVYTDNDRAMVGSAVPGKSPLKLVPDAELRAAFFCERRELGVLNIGGAGSVAVDGKKYPMEKYDCLYVGRGSKDITFTSVKAAAPALFYLLSYPAHAAYSTTLARKADAAAVELGSAADANHRVIRKYIHPGGIKSCQLVMGFTQLAEGSVWNTMPPHTHTRRSEIYLYFDMTPSQRVMHFMGAPRETRHVVVANAQTIISPSWSLHCACGTRAYTFCWGMGGENQAFDDMDDAPIEQLR
jgi:4-deoxy-L-threo-5-hexosulose-uronate ketol-isomerase